MLMNSAVDYTLNIVTKCCFLFIFKHSRLISGPGKFFMGVLESPGFFISKRVEPRFIKHSSVTRWPHDILWCVC